MDKIITGILSKNNNLRYPDTEHVPSGVMAYLGDGFFEVIVRNFFIQKKIWDSHNLHRQVVKYVNAKAQADLLRVLSEHLTEKEKDVVRRGRNSHAGNIPKKVSASDYRYSTGFEALLGYLLLNNNFKRIEELVAIIEDYLEKQFANNV